MAEDLESDVQALENELKNLKETVKNSRKTACDTTFDKHNGDVSAVKASFITRRLLRGHLAKVHALEWGTDSRHLVSVSEDGRLIVWDAITANKVQAVQLGTGWTMTCGYSPSQSCVACGGLDNMCTIFSLKGQDGMAKVRRELMGLEGYLSACKFIDDNNILTSSGDSSCALWDVDSGKQIVSFRSHDNGISSMALSSDKNVFVTGSCDTTAKLWDLRDKGACKQTFAAHKLDINAVNFFPSGFAFATASDDGSCTLFDIRADQQVAKYSQSNANVVSGATSVAFSSSGRLMFAGYDSRAIVAYDVLSTDSVAAMTGHENRVSSLAVSGDGLALASGSWDKQVKIWF